MVATGATPNRINVFVRVKPLGDSERGMDKNKQWQIINDDKCILHKYTREMFTFGKNYDGYLYSIDRVFDGDVSTEEIFEIEGKKLVLSALDGFNVTIFTYG